MKRLRFIFISAIIVSTALALVYTSEVMAEYHRGFIAEMDIEREHLAILEQEKNLVIRENTELRQALQNRTATLSRGGRLGGWLTMPVMQPSGLDATFFERTFVGTGLVGIAEALAEAEAKTGVSALVLAGIIAHETGWGTSALARNKNNMAGLGAYPGEEYSAGIAFGSREESILFLARLLAVNYAPGGRFYGGSHDLIGIGVRYASDPAWARKVDGCMKTISERGQQK